MPLPLIYLCTEYTSKSTPKNDHTATTWRDAIKSQQIMGGAEAKSVNSDKKRI